jgi:hypothetical protein
MSLFKNIENEIKFYIDKKDNVWGVNNPPPINLPDGNWEIFLPTFEPQSFSGKDSNECSQLSAVNALETFLNWLMKTGQMTAVALNWFKDNGYIDTNGSFAFSEDFTGILDGTSINGNIAQNAWKCFQQWGVLPRSQLNWSLEQASQYPDQASMDLAYYSHSRITPAMDALALESKKYINIAWGWIVNGTTNVGLEPLSNGLKTSPLQYVIPIPTPVNEWNQVEIPYLGGTALQHCVTGYKNDQSGIAFPYFITDQYEPWLKQLQSTYYIPVAIAFVVNMLQ